MIILSAFSLIPHLPCNCQLSTVNCQLSTVNCQLHKSVEIRFTFCFRFQYVKDRSGIAARSGNPRAWTSVPGRFPSFLFYIYIIYRDQRIAAPFASTPLRTSQYRWLASYWIFSNRLPYGRLSLFLQKGGVHFDLLDLRLRFGRAASRNLFLHSSERRCSSRTFRYGYLVTT